MEQIQVVFSQNVDLAAGSLLSLSGFTGQPSIDPALVRSVCVMFSAVERWFYSCNTNTLMSGTESPDDLELALQGVWPVGSIDGSAQWLQANGTLLLNLTRSKPHTEQRNKASIEGFPRRFDLQMAGM